MARMDILIVCGFVLMENSSDTANKTKVSI